jgi:hypothetical protein
MPTASEVLFGYGDGTFANLMLALGQQPYAVAAVDLSGDGAPELLIDTGRGPSVFFHVGSGYPTPPRANST